MYIASFPIALVSVVLAVWASAAPRFDAKPGLWEVRHTVVIHSDAASADLSGISPDLRARMEERLARLGNGQPSTQVFQECITQAALEKDPFAEHRSPRGCTDEVLDRTARHITGKLACGTGHGTFEFTAKNPEHVVGVVSVAGQMAGMPGTLRADTEGRWLGSSCGDLEPDGSKLIGKE